MVAGPEQNSLPPKGNAEYRKIQELASGGMGSVELARAVSGPHAGEVVALKRLHPHLEREKHFADMFFDEAWITAGLHHPNVVEIFDWGMDQSGRYLALEFVPGDSLLALIRESKKLEAMIPLDLALYIIGKTAEGLHAAHELRNEQGALRHLVHRDVTPSNILVGLHGEVKLIDFGVAKARDKLSHTSTGTIKGKFGYMSPEQARGFPIDRRSDVFSLGVVLWETLALKRLYRSDSELEILRMIVEDAPAPIANVRGDVPPEIENLIQGSLAKNRDDRLGSCGEFAEFIWAIYHEHGFTAGEREVSALVRRVMPERYDAIEQLLSGSHDFIEPTIARPASGSFSGVGPRPVSGAVPMLRPNAPGPAVGAPSIPMAMPANAVMQQGDQSLLVTSYPAPVTESRPNRTPTIVALAAIGVLSVAGLGWVLGRSHNSSPAAAAPGPSISNAAMTAPVPAITAVPPVVAPTNVAGAGGTPVESGLSAAGPHAAGHPPGHGPHGHPMQTTIAAGAYQPLAPVVTPPPVVVHNDPPPVHEPPPPVVHNDPPPTHVAARPTPPPAVTPAGPATPPANGSNGAPNSARNLFGRDWNN